MSERFAPAAVLLAALGDGYVSRLASTDLLHRYVVPPVTVVPGATTPGTALFRVKEGLLVQQIVGVHPDDGYELDGAPTVMPLPPDWDTVVGAYDHAAKAFRQHLARWMRSAHEIPDTDS